MKRTFSSRHWPMYLIYMLLLISIVTVLSGCGANTEGNLTDGKSSESPSPEGTDATEPKDEGSSSPEWQEVVEAAKKEGAVSIAAPQGEQYLNALKKFSEAYPDIKLELTPSNPSDFQTKVRQERESGKFLWDLIIVGATAPINLYKEGIIDPIVPYLSEEVMQDEIWLGGFDYGFYDAEKKYAFGFQLTTAPQLYLNKEQVPEGDFKSFDELLDPKWKGKIAMLDPRQVGGGDLALLSFYLSEGEESAKKLLTEQDLVFSSDRRQLADWLFRGTYPVVFGADISSILSLEQTTGEKFYWLPEITEALTVTSQWGVVGVVNQAPHPNATKVFLDWLLSEEGQGYYAEFTRLNSRRADVPVVDEQIAVDPNRVSEYPNLNYEELNGERTKVREMANQLIK